MDEERRKQWKLRTDKNTGGTARGREKSERAGEKSEKRKRKSDRIPGMVSRGERNEGEGKDLTIAAAVRET